MTASPWERDPVLASLEDRYRILEPLARGSEGRVYLVEDLRRDGLLAALKILSDSIGPAPEEFFCLARLRHRAIARVLDSGAIRSPSRQYFTTEFYPGAPLTAIPAPFSWALFQTLLAEACDALAYLNAEGYCHGDLKPAHLLYRPAPALSLCVIDLGHAVRLDVPRTRARGTAPYAAPELWRAGEKPARNSDLYALGMISLEILRGGLPFSGDASAWREWHRSADRSPLLDQLALSPPAGLRELIRECIEPDPADRPRDAAALRRRLPSLLPIAERPALPPPLVGRDPLLAELSRWLRDGSTDAPFVIVLGGPPGSGKSRLLEAVARLAQMAGLAVEFRRDGGGRDPDALIDLVTAHLSQADGPGLIVLDELPRDYAIAGRPAPAWLRDLRAREHGSRARVLLVARDGGLAAAEHAVEELSRSKIPSQLRIVGPLDRDSTRILLEERLSRSATPEEMERAWQETGGNPGRLLRGVSSARGESDSGGTETGSGAMDPALCTLLSALPRPVPLAILLEALEWQAPRFFGEIARCGERAPAIEGVHPALVVHPLRAAHAAALAPAGQAPMLRLARRWEEIGADGSDWAPLTLRIAAGEVRDRAVVLAQCDRLARAGRWEALGALAETALARGLDTRVCLLRAWWRTGRAQEALLRFRSWGLAPAAVDADCAAEIARMLAKGGQPSRSLLFFDRAISARPPSVERQEWLTEAAGIALALGRRSLAERWLAALDEVQGGPALPPRAKQRLAAVAHQAGDRARAELLFREALDGARGSEPATVVAALSGLAGLARAAGRYDEAERRMAIGLRYARIVGMTPEVEAETHVLLANRAALLYRRRRTDEAMAEYLRLRDAVRRAGNLRLLPHIEMGIGMIHRDRGEIVAALLVHLRALREARGVANDHAQSNILRNLGTLHLLLASPASAYRCHLDALRIARRIGDQALVREARAGLGAALCRRGCLPEARRHLELALAAGPGGGSTASGAMVHCYLAEAHWLEGAPTAAMQHFGRACRHGIRGESFAYVCRALIGMARLLDESGATERAGSLLDVAERWSRRDPTPLSSRIPIEIARLRLAHRVAAGRAQPSRRAAELYRAAHAHGLWEEALAALLLCRSRASAGGLHVAAPLGAESRVFLSALGRRLGARERAALAQRLRTADLERWLGEVETRAPLEQAAGSSLAATRTIDRFLEDLLREGHATEAELSADIGGRAVVLASVSAAATRNGHALVLSLDLWAGAPPVSLRLSGEGEVPPAPAAATLERLRELIAPSVAALEIDALRQANAELALALDQLRAEALAERERLETEVLSQHLELKYMGSALHPLADPEAEHPRWVAESPALREIERSLERWGGSDLPILISGPSGTGKDYLARRIHERSARARHPFVVENYGSLPESLLEAELFGYARGAFTGAEQDRGGVFDRVAGGTLVLDRVDELPIGVQAKLLRVIEEGSYRPLGAAAERCCDVRLMATCQRPPREALASGDLRPDFYFRMQGVEIALPPLHERREDIPALLACFFDWQSRRLGVPIPMVDDEALQRLATYAWPGNVRELGNLVLRWLSMGVRRITRRELLLLRREDEAGGSPALQAPYPPAGAAWREANADFQRRHLTASLERFRWNRSLTAQALGISRRQLHNLIAKLAIDPPAEE